MPAPAPFCTLCLVRHGETDWNVAHRIQGQTDTPLNSHGQEQARMAARFLRAFTFHAAWSSDLRRARDTAEVLIEGRSLSLITDERLRERRYGVFQTLLYSEAEAQYPELYARYRSRHADCDIDGGESLRMLTSRVQDCLGQIAREHAGQQVLVVTHGGVLDVAYRLATGLPLEAPRDFLITNAAVSVIRGDGIAWQLERWNETPDTEALDDDT
jgi:2,3-bisphosphoglycerate-dependent phosphoglycerate mutase